MMTDALGVEEVRRMRAALEQQVWPDDGIPAPVVTEALSVGIWELCRRANGDPYADAVRQELRRLYRAAGEPLPAALNGCGPEAADYREPAEIWHQP